MSQLSVDLFKERTWRKLFEKGSQTHVFSKPLSKTSNLHGNCLLNKYYNI